MASKEKQAGAAAGRQAGAQADPAGAKGGGGQSGQGRQRGGTVLGVIIGLIIGLSVAVVVALVINKGESPFTNSKVGRAGTPESASAGAVGDPNKPMYGSRDAAKAAAKGFEKEVEGKEKELADQAKAAGDAPAAKEGGKDDAKAEGKTEPRREVKAEPNPAKDGGDDKPKKAEGPAKDAGKDVAKDGTKDGAKASGDEKGSYYLQAGAFREMADAESTRGRLALLGFEAHITEKPGDNGSLFRVRLGPFQQVEAMNKARVKLLEDGVDVAVIRNQR